MSSSRLYAVLRAGEARKGAEDEGGLTRALKKTSLVPTGACLPRNFDPDYCAYDRYYAVGVSVVSAVLGGLIETRTANLLPFAALVSVEKVIGTLCYTVPEKEPDGWFYTSPEPQQYYKQPYRGVAREDFNTLCKALVNGLDAGVDTQTLPFWDEWMLNTGRKTSVFANLALHLVSMVGTPGAMVAGMLPSEPSINVRIPVFVLSIPFTIKYISRFMNEHAMMIGSFFRVNSKSLDANQRLLLDLRYFARMCREDIADGPNPPPEPPTAEELAAARADAEAQRQRTEERDPLMDGIDYPPSIMASYE